MKPKQALMPAKTTPLWLLFGLVLCPLYAWAGEVNAISGQVQALLLVFVLWLALLFIFFKFLRLLSQPTWRGMIGLVGFLVISYSMIQLLDFLIHQAYKR